MRSIVLMSVLAVVLVSGCGGGEQSGPPYLTAAEAAEEYRNEAAGLTLAPGFEWPERPISATAEDGAGMVYEPGFGKQAADFYWYCSWARTALSETTAERETALTEVMKIRSTHYYETALDDASRLFFEGVLDSAELGDMSALGNDVRLNCAEQTSS